MMIGNLEGFTVEPGNCNLTLFRRASEPRHAYEVEITSRRIAVHQFHPVEVAHGDAVADAKRYVPALRKAARRLRRQTFTHAQPQAAAPARIRRAADAVALRDDIRLAFRDLIEKSAAREKAADQERKRAAEAKAAFESEAKRAMQRVVTPTLNEIASMLRRSGWSCEIGPSPSGMSVSLAVHRGTMTAAGETGRPHITFACAPERQTLGVVAATLSAGRGRQEYALSEVTNDFVAEQTLLFFQRLAGESAPLCAD